MMQTQDANGGIIIRRATRKDEQELAELAYTAYYDRFFNDAVTDKYGASLKVYPELIPDEENDTGQSRSTFAEYWRKAMQRLDADKEPFLCFVAEAQTPDGPKIVGFRKGYAAPLEREEFELYQKENIRRSLLRKKYAYQRRNVDEDLRFINLPAYERIAGSSSLYIAPEYKRMRIGERLIRRYAQEILKMGFEGMVTSCYIKNDSRYFLQSMGGDNFIPCPIPCSYRKPDKSLGICNIDGLMCLWDKDALQKLAGTTENRNLRNTGKIYAPQRSRQR